MIPVKTQAATFLEPAAAAYEVGPCTQSASRSHLQVHVLCIAGTTVVARLGTP